MADHFNDLLNFTDQFMKNKHNCSTTCRPARFIGIDWADREHEIHVLDEHGNEKRQTVEHSPEAIEEWINHELQLAGGRPVAIILEQARGALIHALMFRENVVLYPVNPQQFASYRKSYSNAGCKDDRTDARLLARMLFERIAELKAWVPDDERTRLLARLSEARRKLVNQRTRLTQQLTDQLKACYPLSLKLPAVKTFSPLHLEILRRWPDPRQLKKADRRVLVRVFNDHALRNKQQQQAIIESIRNSTLLTTDNALIEPAAIVIKTLACQIRELREPVEQLQQRIDQEMARHPDAALFQKLPGAGQALAPRLLTAFGSQRDRFNSAQDVSAFSGIAPVTKQSGKSCIVHRRYACPKFLRQTFHEFADHARKWCPWSKAYYRLQRSRGMKHHAAIRKLASRWIRILFVVWKTRTPYDPQKYLSAIMLKNPNIIPFLNNETLK
jgi:transposase